jgi:hypothetical protein
MSALTTTFVTDLLNHYFTNAAHANIGNGSGLQPSGAAGSFFYQLHTADPGDGGSQLTNEVAYTGYTRPAAARSGSGFSVSGKNVSPAAEVSFGKRTDAGPAVVAYFWSIGTTGGSGGGNPILRGGIGAAPRPFAAVAGTTITCPGHGLALDDTVVFWSYEGTGIVLPAPLVEGTVYFVKSPTADAFSVSATQPGSAINLTGAGQGTAQRLTPITITQNVTPKLETGTVIKFQ